MQNTIKGCPHCGGTASLKSSYSYKNKVYYVFVKCDICGAQGKAYKSPEDPASVDWNNNTCVDALKAWNLRKSTEE